MNKFALWLSFFGFIFSIISIILVHSYSKNSLALYKYKQCVAAIIDDRTYSTKLSSNIFYQCYDENLKNVKD